MTTKPVSNETLLQQLEWRYATKAFDPAKKISDVDWATLEKALVLTPTSYGMQPIRFLVVTDQETKEKLVPVSWNQRQPAECSHFVVFAARARNTEADVDRYLERITEVRGGSTDALGGLKKMLMGDVVNGPRGKAALEWATRQAYIALGNFMTAAALVGVDTCPWKVLSRRSTTKSWGFQSKAITPRLPVLQGIAPCRINTQPRRRSALRRRNSSFVSNHFLSIHHDHY
jgi:nitroreductase